MYNRLPPKNISSQSVTFWERGLVCLSSSWICAHCPHIWLDYKYIIRTVLWKTFRANRNNVRGETKERELPRRGQVLTLKWLSTSKRTIYRRFVTMTNYGIIPPSTIKSSSSTQDVSGVALRWSWGWKVGISMWNERKIRTTWGRFVASDTHNLSEMTIRISLHEFPH